MFYDKFSVRLVQLFDKTYKFEHISSPSPHHHMTVNSQFARAILICYVVLSRSPDSQSCGRLIRKNGGKSYLGLTQLQMSFNLSIYIFFFFAELFHPSFYADKCVRVPFRFDLFAVRFQLDRTSLLPHLCYRSAAITHLCAHTHQSSHTPTQENPKLNKVEVYSSRHKSIKKS